MTTLTSVSVFAPVPYAISPALQSMHTDFAKARRMQAKSSGGKGKGSRQAHPTHDDLLAKARAAQFVGDVNTNQPFQMPTRHEPVVYSAFLHKLILAEIPGAMIALRVKDVTLGGLFYTSKTLRDLMTEEECGWIYAFDKRFSKKPDGVSADEWNAKKNEHVGGAVLSAIHRTINEARYTRQDAPMGTVIGTRNKLAFLTELPALAKVKIIKVRKHDDDDRVVNGRCANRAAK